MAYFDNSDIGLNANSLCVCGKNRKFAHCCGLPRADVRPPFGVVVKKRWLSLQLCDKLVAYAKNQYMEAQSTTKYVAPVLTSEYQNDRTYASVDETFRKSSTVKLGESAQKKITQLSVKAFRGWAKTHGLKPLAKCEPPALMCYEPGGFFKAHADAEILDPATLKWQRTLNRDASLLMYLNDDYEGGTLKFNRFNFRFNPKKGDLLIFPAHNLYLHEVEPVCSGQRFVVVSWARY